MKKMIEWLKASNRWKHLAGGFLLGGIAEGWYMASVLGAGVGGAMEFKDYQWGGKPDMIDAAFTLAGTFAGYGLRSLIV